MASNEAGDETTSHENEWEVSNAEESDDKKEATSRGNEWEVVSLTASAYAAAPGPRGDELVYEDSTISGNDEAEISRALFMSGHFVFPPSQHENLPIVPEKIDSPTRGQEDDFFPDMDLQKEGVAEKLEENWSIGKLEGSEDFPGIPLFDEKGHRNASGFDETTIHGLDVGKKEQNFYGSGKLSSFRSGTIMGDPATYDESTIMNDSMESPGHGIDPSTVVSKVLNSGKQDDDDDSLLPCGAWWKRSVASLRAQVKETSTFWSIFVAAAVMGLVVLGQRWQQERWQVLHQRWQVSLGDEKSGRVLSRLKDVIVGGSRSCTYITSVSAEH